MNGSPDSGPRLEVHVDHDARMVNIKMWRALDLAPTPISFPCPCSVRNWCPTMTEPRNPMKRMHDLATVQTVFLLISGALADFEKRLALAGVNLPEADRSTSVEQAPTAGTPCE